MDIKLERSVECAINEFYNIEGSIFEDIQKRQEAISSATNTIKSILDNAPPKLPEKRNSTDPVERTIENAKYNYELKRREIEQVEEQLALLDIEIDKIDLITANLENKALPLVNEINSYIDEVKNAYDLRVTTNCKNILTWSFIRDETLKDESGNEKDYKIYKVIKKPQFEITKNYYGIKYYQPPSNRDYGYSIISEFTGSIGIGTTVLAVLSAGSTSFMSIGDQITNDEDNYSTFGYGSIPKIVGFTTTIALGIVTSIYGSISVGSSVIAYTGIGSTENISVGHYTLNNDIFSSNTTVVGFGTTVTAIEYVGPSGVSTQYAVVPSIILNQVSIGSTVNSPLGFGTYAQYDAIILDKFSYAEDINEEFINFRDNSNNDEYYNYTDSPLQPVKIGILKSQNTGIGNRSVLINNGSPSTTRYWNDVSGDPEPSVGAGYVSYYTGDNQWPYTTEYGYAEEDTVYKFEDGVTPGYTSTPPSPQPTVSACNLRDDKIEEAEAKLQDAINKNVKKIKTYVNAAGIMRYSRNEYEKQAWAYSQAISYLNYEMKKITEQIKDIEDIDFSSLL